MPRLQPEKEVKRVEGLLENGMDVSLQVASYPTGAEVRYFRLVQCQ